MKIEFTDKHVQDLNLPLILRNSEVLKSIPTEFEYRKPPVIVYKHTSTIRNKVLNYAKEVTDFDFKEFQRKERNGENTCNCQRSKFKDSFHHHIITGDLNIIENESLRWLLQQGPNFREQKNKCNFNHIWKNLNFGINE